MKQENLNTITSIILTEIEKFDFKQGPFVIGIDGRCASGKSTLAQKLSEKLNANIVHMDHFFLQKEQRTNERLNMPGGNFDIERFQEEIIKTIKSNQAITYRPYNCHTFDFDQAISLDQKDIIIIEGSYSCHPELVDNYHLSLFLTISPKQQIERIFIRNGEELAQMFEKRWIPMEENYFTQLKVRENCTYIVDVEEI